MQAKLINTIGLGVIVLPLLLAGSTTAFAQEEDPTEPRDPSARIEQAQQEVDERRQQRQENIQARCEITTNRIDNVTERYENNKLRYINRYERLITRLENLVDYLEGRDIDTLDLPNQIQELKSQQAEFELNIDAAISHLENSKQFACGESEGAFRNELQNARQDLLEGRADAVGINQYFQNTIVSELELIRESLN